MVDIEGKFVTSNLTPYVAGVIEACEYTNNTSSPASILQNVVDGSSALVDFGKGFAIYDTIKNSEGDYLLRILVIHGKDVEKWISAVDATAETLARTLGCVGILAVGRTGWRKECSKHGYKTTHSIFYKDVYHA